MTEEKKRQILSIVDHTLLKAASSREHVEELCREAIKYKTASVCVPPSYVKRVVEKYGGELTVCAVAGFPMGFTTTETKVFETKEAIQNGADEIDMVINIGDVKNGDFDLVERELAALRKAAEGKILKVIIETCYLEKDEKIKLCRLVTERGADFIKTSTGLGPGGAVLEDIDLMRANTGKGVRIKAAGGMRTAEDHEAFFDRGVDRIGSSSAVKALYGGED
jgi:deoxyribose-phosphate aldolase